MRTGPQADPVQTHFAVLGLDEDATLVRRRIEEEYEKRARQCLQRLAKIDDASPEAETLRARLAQLNAAQAILVPRKSRQEYSDLVRKLRTSERELAETTGKGGSGRAADSSAVLILHLRQQVERIREELQRTHEEQCRRHARAHLGDEGQAQDTDEGEDASSEATRRRVARIGEPAAVLAALAARRPLKRA